MAELAQHANPHIARRESLWGELFRKEDLWAIWIGLALVAVAVAWFAAGGSVKWIAVAPQKWSLLAEVGTQLTQHGLQFAALFVLFAVAFGAGIASLGIP